MYCLQTLKIPVIWLLVFSLAHLPVLWVHRHSDLKESELAPHLAAYHEQMPELELGVWHIHLLSSATSAGSEGFQPERCPDDAAQEKCQKFCLQQNVSVTWLRRVEQRGQHATAKVADLIVSGNLVSAGLVRHSRWSSARHRLNIQSLFCVFLI